MSLVANENSYISLDDADKYFEERLFSNTWDAATPEDKAKALIMATKKIDRQPLRGRKADESQILQFPRVLYSYDQAGIVGDITTKGFGGPGWYIQNAVPKEVKDACCEEAMAIIEIGNTKRIKLQQQGVKSMSVDKMSETYIGKKIVFFSQEAAELLSPYLAYSVVIS